MLSADFLTGINQKYFHGELSDAQLSYLNDLDADNVEAIEFAEGVFARMQRIGISSKDSAEFIFMEIGNVIPKILPGAWGGIVPPITFINRHVLIEDYLEKNQWRPLIAGNRVLDMGCGFPPYTAVDLARRFPKVDFIGADPSFGKYTITDKEGNYACINEDGSLKYLQPGNVSNSQWTDVFRDLGATKQRFREMFLHLEKQLPGQESKGSFEEFNEEGQKIVRNPLRKYATNNLYFVQQGIGSDVFPKDLDMIRCMNVLMYFDPAFRKNALSWASRHLKEGGLFICGLNYAESLNCRFSVYQKQDGMMRFREFAFSIENIRPMQIVPYFAFRNEDFEQDQLMEHVALIRRDADFMKIFNSTFDKLLEQHAVCKRKIDGYLGMSDTSLPRGVLQLNMVKACRPLAKELAGAAVKVLNDNGRKAWVNEIGFIAVGDLE